MRRSPAKLLVAAAAIVLACQTGGSVEQAQGSRTAFADLRDARGRSVGHVELRDGRGKVDAELHVDDLPQGEYTVSVQRRGECDARPGSEPFRSTGDPLRSRAGEPLVTVVTTGHEGSAVVRFSMDGVGVTGAPVALLDGDGSSVLVLDGGGSPRACGVVRP